MRNGFFRDNSSYTSETFVWYRTLSPISYEFLCWLSDYKYVLNMHCKNKISKIQNKYTQKRNSAASVSITTFMCLWAIYIFPRPVCKYSAAWKYVVRSWEYKNRSQTHECGNWDWGRAIPFLEIHKWDFRCSVALPCTVLEPKEPFSWSAVYTLMLALMIASCQF